MQVLRLPALSDNYIYVLHDRPSNTAAVVDPAEAKPVLDCLQELQAELVAIFNTHHHQDHIGGNGKLLQHFPGAVVYGGAEDRGRIPEQQVFLQEGDRVDFADHTGEVLFVPGHTHAHIAYYFPPSEPQGVGELFSGDTLFSGGCGRLLEGTPEQMLHSLSKLRALPDHTWVWCGHEYTLKNLQFAQSIDQNPDLALRLAEVKAARSRLEPTVPSLLGLEKQTNPFLRWDNPRLKASVNAQDDLQTFTRLRGLKDQF